MQALVETNNLSVTSAFSPTQINLILALSGLAVLIALWSLSRGLRPWLRGDPVRLTPFGFAALNLAFAFIGYLVTQAIPMVVRYPLSLPLSAVGGIVAWWLAHSLDRWRFGIPEEEKAPSKLDALRGCVAAKLSNGESAAKAGTLIGHVKALVTFFAGSEWLKIDSRYDPGRSLARIMDSGTRGDIVVRKERGQELWVISARHGARTNILPVFRGRLVDNERGCTLEGRIQLETGIVIVLGLFALLMLVYLPFAMIFKPTPAAGNLSGVAGMLVYLGILEFVYFCGKNDSAIIRKNLENALKN